MSNLHRNNTNNAPSFNLALCNTERPACRSFRYDPLRSNAVPCRVVTKMDKPDQSDLQPPLLASLNPTSPIHPHARAFHKITNRNGDLFWRSPLDRKPMQPCHRVVIIHAARGHRNGHQREEHGIKNTALPLPARSGCKPNKPHDKPRRHEASFNGLNVVWFVCHRVPICSPSRFLASDSRLLHGHFSGGWLGRGWGEGGKK